MERLEINNYKLLKKWIRGENINYSHTLVSDTTKPLFASEFKCIFIHKNIISIPTNYLFYHSKLEILIFSKYIKYIHSNAFHKCHKLKKVIIPNIENLTCVSPYAF